MTYNWDPRSLRDLPYSPIMDRPTTHVRTGIWRTFKPVIDQGKCTKCYICWKFCPDVSILILDEEEGRVEIDYDHCKGCGICAEVCPIKCIEMERE
ncbi:MAG: 4Fe-4S dicluster-binding protein [Thermoplasmata archaeon]